MILTSVVGENYFDYGAPLKSKRLGEHVAIANGFGPLCGFGSAEWDSTNNITLKPYGYGDNGGASQSTTQSQDITKKIINSRIRARKIPTNPGAVIQDSNFACITRDGTLFRSSSTEIKVSISNNRRVLDQIFVFAYHDHITEPVTNLVQFCAYYNEGDVDFYDIWKKSQDIYYPKSKEDRDVSISDDHDPLLSNLTDELSFYSLEDKVASCCPDFYQHLDSMTLIGIYGRGTDTVKNIVEEFAIIPYNNVYPFNIPYNLSLHSYFKEAISKMQNFLGYSQLESQGYTDIVSYVDAVLKENLSKLTQYTIPQGAIMLWEGTTPPEGWEEYSPASGRVVVGYRSGGINILKPNGTSSNILKNPGEYYTPNPEWNFTIKGEDLPSHHHRIGTKRQDLVYWDKGTHTKVVDWSEKQDGSITDRDYTLITGPNTKGGSNQYDTVDDNTSLILDKLVPAITLMYIKKK